MLPPFTANPALVLAASGMAGVLGWSLVLLVLIFIAFFAVVRLRAWLKDDATPTSVGFSLTDLRQLHREGKMTDEEFEKARNLMVAHAKQMAEKLPHPLAGRKTAAERSQQATNIDSNSSAPQRAQGEHDSGTPGR